MKEHHRMHFQGDIVFGNDVLRRHIDSDDAGIHPIHPFNAGDDKGNPRAAHGLKFPEPIGEPIYWDFLYFSFTIGVAAQTADVAISSRYMRKLVLLHAVLSFLFNTTILALAINVGASLLGGGQ